MNRWTIPMIDRTATAKRGFTLVEILIVVVLLAILAAIVVPKFTDVVGGSRKTSLQEQLRRVRTDIQLYKLQHNDTPPALTAGPGTDWTDLTTAKPNGAGTMCGPYMQTVPKNPLNNFSDIHIVGADPAWGDAVPGVNIGFVYNSNTGYIWGTSRTGGLVFNEDNINDPNNDN